MRNAIAAAIVLSGGLFQIVQKPSLPVGDRSLSLEEGCSSTKDRQSGLATQGGYRFGYESVKGLNCRDYGLVNTPGQQSVKVKWRDTRDRAERILCETRLLACPIGSACQPFHCPQPGQALQDLQPTELGYGGPNADSHTDRPPAYVMNTSAVSGLAPPFLTVMQGTAADRAGKPVDIAVEVTSSVSGTQPPYRLSYGIRIDPKARPFTLWLPEGKPGPAELVLRWGALDAGEPLYLIQKQGGLRLSVDRPTASIGLSAGKFERSLSHVVIMQDNDRIAAVTAPIYVPSR